VVRNKCSKTITPTLHTNINNIISSVEEHNHTASNSPRDTPAIRPKVLHIRDCT
jgi:hypothetical protein